MSIYKGSTPISKNATSNWQAAFPDWKRLEIKASGVTYTSSKYGYILIRNTVYTDNFRGFINGNEVFHQYGHYSLWEDWNSIMLAIAPGDTYQISGSGGELIFIPAKGN